jgi:hypothetical protein
VAGASFSHHLNRPGIPGGSGDFDGLHGWDLLRNPANGEFGSVAAKVAAFLTAHTRG